MPVLLECFRWNAVYIFWRLVYTKTSFDSGVSCSRMFFIFQYRCCTSKWNYFDSRYLEMFWGRTWRKKNSSPIFQFSLYMPIWFFLVICTFLINFLLIRRKLDSSRGRFDGKCCQKGKFCYKGIFRFGLKQTIMLGGLVFCGTPWLRLCCSSVFYLHNLRLQSFLIISSILCCQWNYFHIPCNRNIFFCSAKLIFSAPRFLISRNLTFLSRKINFFFAWPEFYF